MYANVKKINFDFAASQRPRQRNLLTYAPGKRAAAAATSTSFSLSESEDLSSSVIQRTSEVNSDRGTLDFSLITHLKCP